MTVNVFVVRVWRLALVRDRYQALTGWRHLWWRLWWRLPPAPLPPPITVTPAPPPNAPPPTVLHFVIWRGQVGEVACGSRGAIHWTAIWKDVSCEMCREKAWPIVLRYYCSNR